MRNSTGRANHGCNGNSTALQQASRTIEPVNRPGGVESCPPCHEPSLRLSRPSALLASASASAAKPKLAITSSLDGKTVLPHRIHWIARPNVSQAQVRQVDFLIDGKLAWIEHMPPYNYSEDENGAHLGYLVTSWLTPGRHRFAVRAITFDGRKVTDTVTARVTARPDLPAGLAGTWQRLLSDTSAAPAPGTADNPTDNYFPSGTYTIVIDPRMLQTRWPGTFRRPQSDQTGEGWITDSDYTVAVHDAARRRPGHLRAKPRTSRDGLVVLAGRAVRRLRMVDQRRHAHPDGTGRRRPVRQPRLRLGRPVEARRMSSVGCRRAR